MPHRSLQGHACSERISYKVGLLDVEVFHERGNIICHRFVGDRAVDVGGTPVRLQIDRDDLARFREQGHEITEHRHRSQTAMQQDERLTRALDLVVQLEPIHGGVPSFRRRSGLGQRESRCRQHDAGSTGSNQIPSCRHDVCSFMGNSTPPDLRIPATQRL